MNGTSSMPSWADFSHCTPDLSCTTVESAIDPASCPISALGPLFSSR
jgi:hypothetical protein